MTTPPNITDAIMAALATAPANGLTTREVIAVTGRASYQVSGKLSKLAAYGKIVKVMPQGQVRARWKPAIKAVDWRGS